MPSKPRNPAELLRAIMQQWDDDGWSEEFMKECEDSLAAYDARQRPEEKRGQKGIPEHRRKKIGLAKGTKAEVAERFGVSIRTVGYCRAWVKANC